MLLLLLLPGSGFIFLFLSVALVLTFSESVGFMPFFGEQRLTFENWTKLINRAFIDSFLFSLKVGVVSAFGALLFAYPLAIYLRRKFFAARVINSIIKIPLFVPALVAAFLILNTLAFNGVINNILLGLGIINQPLRMLNDQFGWDVVIIQIWKNLPFQLLIIASVLESVRFDLEDAAANLGASRWRVIWHVLVPLSMPGVLIAVALVFVMVFGDFAITRVAGPIYPTSLAVLMHTSAFTFQDWGKAACVGLIITGTSLAMVALYARMVRLMQEFGR
jgi:putative spermidine/putrescine transport system permease protein